MTNNKAAAAQMSCLCNSHFRRHARAHTSLPHNALSCTYIPRSMHIRSHIHTSIHTYHAFPSSHRTGGDRTRPKPRQEETTRTELGFEAHSLWLCVLVCPPSTTRLLLHYSVTRSLSSQASYHGT
jgi:hypothetical protein